MSQTVEKTRIFIGATIRIGQEIRCLLYAGFFLCTLSYYIALMLRAVQCSVVQFRQCTALT